MPTRIQIRRGTASQWTTANPILAAGEFGLETNTGKVKLGNATTAWTSLAYFGNLEALDNIGDVVITSAATGQVLQYNGTNWVNSDVTISEVTGLQTALDGKSGTSHTHTFSTLTDFQVTSPASGQTLQYNGTKWVNTAASSGETFNPFLLMGA